MSKLEKITFRPEGEEPVEFYVLEQTRIGGHNYILVTDVEEGDGDALILKDMSQDGEEESIYDVVSDDEELEAVIAHELSHIRNRDVRLLIVSIVFVGIFAMLAQIAMRSVYYSSFTSSRDREGKGNGTIVIVLVMLVAAVGYFFSMLMRFAISRKREYMADAGAAEMTKNPRALASALRKISADPDIEAVHREDVAQLFIEHPGKQAESALSGLSGLFATHPPIGKRIQILEQF